MLVFFTTLLLQHGAGISWPVWFSAGDWHHFNLSDQCSVSGPTPRLQKIFPDIADVFLAYSLDIVSGLLCYVWRRFSVKIMFTAFILDVIPIISNIVQTIKCRCGYFVWNFFGTDFIISCCKPQEKTSTPSACFSCHELFIFLHFWIVSVISEARHLKSSVICR